MVPYRKSLPGKLMTLAMGLYFLAIGLRSTLEPAVGLRVFVLLMCIAIGAIIFAVPMGMLKHVGQTLFVLCVVPFLVWGGFPGVRALLDSGHTGLANALIVVGVLAVLAGLRPSKQSAA